MILAIYFVLACLKFNEICENEKTNNITICEADIRCLCSKTYIPLDGFCLTVMDSKGANQRLVAYQVREKSIQSITFISSGVFSLAFSVERFSKSKGRVEPNGSQL